MVKKTDVKRIVSKTFKESKSGGYKKIRTRAADGYAGLSNREILKITKNNVKFRQFSIKFCNKAKPRPVRVKNIHDQHQVDLVDMRKMQVVYQGKTYRYIFSLMDIFSRFHWLAPLERKLSHHVMKELRRIYNVHGQPQRLQSDNGGEFKKSVKKYCQEKKIRMITSRPYNPKAQGKVERSHRVLRQKIHYDLMTQRDVGVNWAKNVPEYMKCLNNEKREELGWKSPFEVYFGRKSNELVNAAVPVQDDDVHFETFENPLDSDYGKREKEILKLRNRARESNKKIEQRMIQAHARKNTYMTYKPGETVFVRIVRNRKGKASKRQRIAVGRILKRYGQSDMYEVRFKNPGEKRPSERKIFVEDLANYDIKQQNQRKSSREKEINDRRIKHKSQFYIPLTKNDRLLNFNDQKYEIMFDPAADGNCQFSAVSHALQQHGIYKTPYSIREEVVQYLLENDVGPDGTPLELFAATPWSDYVTQMARNGTYGDEITLRAISNIYNIEIRIVSTLGSDAATVILPSDSNSTGQITLGHFHETQGIHYVVLQREQESDAESFNNYDEFNGGLTDTFNHESNDPIGESFEPDNERLDTSIQVSEGKPVNEQDLVTYFELLPPEILERIFMYALAVSDFTFPTHVCWTYNNLLKAYDLFKGYDRKAQQQLPRIYIPNPDVLPRQKLLKTVTVNIQRLVRAFSSASEVVYELKRIIQSSRWVTAWIVLLPEAFSWFIIVDIFWKTKK